MKSALELLQLLLRHAASGNVGKIVKDQNNFCVQIVIWGEDVIYKKNME